METKQYVFDEICQLLGLSDLHLGVGSSVPRQFFSEICNKLDIDDSGNVLEVSRRIVLSAGLNWSTRADSSTTPSGGGGTITLEGMQLLLQSVIVILDRRDSALTQEIDLVIPANPKEWTLIEGQQTTRSILSSRFGCSKLAAIAPSAWTENILIFYDPASSDVIASIGKSIDNISIRISSTSVNDETSELLNIADLLDHVRNRRRIRLFEGTFGQVKYIGEFVVTTRELLWSGPSKSDVVVPLTRIHSITAATEVEANKTSQETTHKTLGIDYIQVEHIDSLSTEPIPFEVDPDLLDRALRSHAIAQNFLAKWLEDRGLQPMSPAPQSPQFDLLWTVGKEVFVTEVKSINEKNERQQFRLGLGQVLDYAQELDATPVLFLSSKPKNARLLAVASRAKVILMWPEILDTIATQIHQDPM